MSKRLTVKELLKMSPKKQREIVNSSSTFDRINLNGAQINREMMDAMGVRHYCLPHKDE